MRNVILFIFDTVLQILLILFSYIVPKKKGLILLTSSDGISLTDNPKYLYQYLLNNKTGFLPYWSTKNHDLFIKLKNNDFPVTYIYSLNHFIKALRSEIIICDDTENPVLYNGLFYFLGRFKSLLTWHGTGFKKIGLMDDKYSRESYPFRKILFSIRKKIYQNYFFIIATSEKDKERKKLCFQNKNIYITGSPRNDIFFNKEYDSELKRKYNLEQYSKILLYVPTYRENNTNKPFSKKFYDKFQNYLNKENYVFIIKKHKYDKALFVPDNHQNIIDMSTQISDVQELMLVTDVLISDYSSIVTDFVLTGNPILFYIYDYKEYTRSCRNFMYDLKEVLPGPFVYDEEDLLNKISNLSWFNNTVYKKKYDKFQNDFQKYKDGKSSERVVNILK